MSGAAPGRRGARLERVVVTILKEHGLEAHRVPLSGSVKGYPGDSDLYYIHKTTFGGP